MSAPGRARSTAEMRFYISLESCPHCGKRVDPEPLMIYGDTTSWALSGDCRWCGRPIGFSFLTTGDPLEVQHRYNELGPGHSELLSPRRFMEEIETLRPKLQPEPSRLGVSDWIKNRMLSTRFDICINELAKFLPSNESSIPDSVLRDDDRAYRKDHPERYTRSWIDEVAAYQKVVQDAIIADIPRIDALETEADKHRPKGIEWLERDAMQAHEAWVERGKKGKGRLVLVGAEHEDMNVGRGVELSGSRFFDVAMPNVMLEDAKFHAAELTDARFERGRFYGAEFKRAKIKGGSFKRAILETAELQQATIDGTDFSEAELHFSEWKGANVSNATFDRATFGDANLDEAVFRNCSFRSADFGADDPDQPPSTKARFDGCDLTDTNWEARDVSGAVFVNCKLAGAHGKPLNADKASIEDADIATTDVLKAWGAK
jgi:uncharacterized protein YjbI with pentapeptide repeats